MAIITPPAKLTMRELGRWRLDTKTPTPGPGMDGRSQFIHREARLWRNSYQVLGAWFDDGQEQYEAFLDMLKGPVNTFDLPIKSRVGGSATLFVTEDGDFAFEPSADNMLVTDGSDNPTVSSTAAIRATTLTLSGANGDIVNVGSFFSYNAFAYRVATNTSGVITFNPPLREEIAASEVLEVEAPVIRVRLESDAAAMAAHEFTQIGAPHVLSVVEAFDR